MKENYKMFTYKFKMYTAKRNKHLHRAINIAHAVWNKCIEVEKSYKALAIDTKKDGSNKLATFSEFDYMGLVARLKKLEKYSYWNKLGSSASRNVGTRIAGGWKAYYELQKNGYKKSKPPKFKKRKDYNSITYVQSNYTILEGNKIRIQDHTYRYFKSREIEGNVKQITIKRDKLGTFWLYIVTDFIKECPQIKTGEVVAYDFGLKTFLTSSDGTDIESPLFYKQMLPEFRIAHRQLSRKEKRCITAELTKKGKLKQGKMRPNREQSKNYWKAKQNLDRLYRKINDRRTNFFHTLSNKLTDQYDIIFLETLNIKGMQMLWGKKICDLGFSNFLITLEQYAKTKGKVIHYINQWEPTSKKCNTCGNKHNDLQLKDRFWGCEICGTYWNRDKNAALNILATGLKELDLAV